MARHISQLTTSCASAFECRRIGETTGATWWGGPQRLILVRSNVIDSQNNKLYGRLVYLNLLIWRCNHVRTTMVPGTPFFRSAKKRRRDPNFERCFCSTVLESSMSSRQSHSVGIWCPLIFLTPCNILFLNVSPLPLQNSTPVGRNVMTLVYKLCGICVWFLSAPSS